MEAKFTPGSSQFVSMWYANLFETQKSLSKYGQKVNYTNVATSFKNNHLWLDPKINGQMFEFCVEKPNVHSSSNFDNYGCYTQILYRHGASYYQDLRKEKMQRVQIAFNESASKSIVVTLDSINNASIELAKKPESKNNDLVLKDPSYIGLLSFVIRSLIPKNEDSVAIVLLKLLCYLMLLLALSFPVIELCLRVESVIL